jgi:hypothetical protein
MTEQGQWHTAIERTSNGVVLKAEGLSGGKGAVLVDLPPFMADALVADHAAAQTVAFTEAEALRFAGLLGEETSKRMQIEQTVAELPFGVKYKLEEALRELEGLNDKSVVTACIHDALELLEAK